MRQPALTKYTVNFQLPYPTAASNSVITHHLGAPLNSSRWNCPTILVSYHMKPACPDKKLLKRRLTVPRLRNHRVKIEKNFLTSQFFNTPTHPGTLPVEVCCSSHTKETSLSFWFLFSHGEVDLACGYFYRDSWGPWIILSIIFLCFNLQISSILPEKWWTLRGFLDSCVRQCRWCLGLTPRTSNSARMPGRLCWREWTLWPTPWPWPWALRYRNTRFFILCARIDKDSFPGRTQGDRVLRFLVYFTHWCLTDWLLDWLIDWLVGCLIDWLIGWLISRLIDWFRLLQNSNRWHVPVTLSCFFAP